MKPVASQCCADILQLFDRWKTYVATTAEAHGLTKVQLFALYQLYEYDGLAMGRVAGVFHCDASNVTGIIDRLMVQGLVTRLADEQDRRTKRIYLTAKAKEIVCELKRAIHGQLGCQRLNDEERALLHKILQKMATENASPLI